jgi:hypothetical protein
MKTLILAAIRCSLMFLVTASLFSVRPAQAGYIVTLQRVGPNVVATGSGAIDLTGLIFLETGLFVSGIFPSFPSIHTGPTSELIDRFVSVGVFSGPTSFGSGSVTFASSGSGDMVGIIVGGGPSRASRCSNRLRLR